MRRLQAIEESPRSWGSVARKGAGQVREGGAGTASSAWRSASAAASAAEDEIGAVGKVAPEGEWILVEEIRDEATEAVERAGRKPRKIEPAPIEIDDDLKVELTRAVGANKGDRVEKRLKEASKDFQRERFGEAARTLRPLAEQAPGVASVRELYGLTLYRQGKWRLAVKELEAFRTITSSTEANPVLADCYRALRQWPMVEELWIELKDVSPSAELVTEGRIVTAGAKADRRDLTGAIELLEQGWRFPKKPQDHHLRRAYALADLYERAGDLPRARDLFTQIARFDPDFSDVGIRIRSLR